MSAAPTSDSQDRLSEAVNDGGLLIILDIVVGEEKNRVWSKLNLQVRFVIRCHFRQTYPKSSRRLYFSMSPFRPVQLMKKVALHCLNYI